MATAVPTKGNSFRTPFSVSHNVFGWMERIIFPSDKDRHGCQLQFFSLIFLHLLVFFDKVLNRFAQVDQRLEDAFSSDGDVQSEKEQLLLIKMKHLQNTSSKTCKVLLVFHNSSLAPDDL